LTQTLAQLTPNEPSDHIIAPPSGKRDDQFQGLVRVGIVRSDPSQRGTQSQNERERFNYKLEGKLNHVDLSTKSECSALVYLKREIQQGGLSLSETSQVANWHSSRFGFEFEFGFD
jgi:hypothetical protein